MVVMLIISCEKDQPTPQPDPIVDPYIAPCSVTEKYYDKDSLYFGPSNYHPEAKYTVRFMDTLSNGSISHYVEYSFNKIPLSGKYNMVYKIDTNNINLPNQMAFATDSGSFIWRSGNSYNAEVYIKKTAQELIISYCNISDSVMSFNSTDFCYVGTKPTSLLLRKQY